MGVGNLKTCLRKLGCDCEIKVEMSENCIEQRAVVLGVLMPWVSYPDTLLGV
jgi:hypothetical protein